MAPLTSRAGRTPIRRMAELQGLDRRTQSIQHRSSCIDSIVDFPELNPTVGIVQRVLKEMSCVVLLLSWRGSEGPPFDPQLCAVHVVPVVRSATGKVRPDHYDHGGRTIGGEVDHLPQHTLVLGAAPTNELLANAPTPDSLEAFGGNLLFLPILASLPSRPTCGVCAVPVSFDEPFVPPTSDCLEPPDKPGEQEQEQGQQPVLTLVRPSQNKPKSKFAAVVLSN